MAGAASTQPRPHGPRQRPRAGAGDSLGVPHAARDPAGGQQVVGRDESCDTVLSGNEVSRRHAEFRVDGPVAAVRDLQSRNGVFVNGGKRADAPLAGGTSSVAANGSAWCRWRGRHDGFREIAAGWFGGATLAAAVEHGARLNGDCRSSSRARPAPARRAWPARSTPGAGAPVRSCRSTAPRCRGSWPRRSCSATARGRSPAPRRPAPGSSGRPHGGSLFLDEILDLPAALQPKLLRVLEDRQVRALGETRQTPVDVRIIAATQEPLAQAVADGASGRICRRGWRG